MREPPAPRCGYALALDAEVIAYVHPDGSLSLERADGAALDLAPAQVEKLAEVLRLSAAARGQAARRRARLAYAVRFEPEVNQ